MVFRYRVSFFVCVLIFSISITISTSSAQDDEDQRYLDCSTEIECGTLRFGFPFWGSDRPSYCGLPEFNLTCNDRIPTISIADLTYRILAINNNSRILTLLQDDYARSLCPAAPRNATEVLNLFEFTIDTQLLTLYYGCESLGIQAPPTLGSFTCSSQLDDYFVPTDGAFQAYESMVRMWLGGCRNRVRVPVNQTAVGSLEREPTVARLTETINQGFGMRWPNGNDTLCTTCRNSGGRCGFNDTTRSFTCFCVDQPYGEECPTAATGPTAQPGRISKAAAIAIGVSAGGGAVAGIAICFWLLISRQRKRKAAQIISKDLSTPPSSTAKTRTTPTTKYSNTTSSSYTTSSSDIEKGPGSTYFGVQVFTYEELDEATDSFDSSKELGDGGFGTVYYGELEDGRAVAVKRLYENNMRRTEQFMNEIEILAKLRHKNLVTLYGCTSRHSKELLLVYEYISNGTVADHLHGNRRQSGSTMTWRVRMKIAIETADALSFLHASDVIHRDVKTNNVLLDENFHVKVADFGLSRLFPLHVTHVSTAPQGTPGYVDPEYYQCYQLTDKSDVYSFGVVLMELITSLQAVDTCRHRHDINLANMAVSRIQNQQLGEVVDPSLGFDTDYGVKRMVTGVAELAFRCLQQERDMRPTMSEVVGMLRRIEKENDGNQKAEVVDIAKDDVVLLQNFSSPVLSPDSSNDKWNKVMRTM